MGQTENQELSIEQRAQRITEVAGFLTEVLSTTLMKSGLSLPETMLCAMLAVRGVGQLALHTQGPDGTLDEKALRDIAEKAFAHAQRTEVMAVRLDSKEEFDTFMQSLDTGLH